MVKGEVLSLLGQNWPCKLQLKWQEIFQLQVLLDKKSRKLVVVNTHKGLYRYTQLWYGMWSAPGIFQRLMESVLQGIPSVIVYLDVILIMGATKEDHLQTFLLVLEQLERAGFRARKAKCSFMQPSVTNLGHKSDQHGLQFIYTSKEKTHPGSGRMRKREHFVPQKSS